MEFDESIRFVQNNKTTNLIDQARKTVQYKSEQQKLQIAIDHFINALHYKAPRFNFLFDDCSFVFRMVYSIQTSRPWNLVLIVVSYVFMYLILITHRKPGTMQAWTQVSILVIMWLDVVMEVYHKSDKILRAKSKFQFRFYAKVSVLLLLTIDQILAMINSNNNQYQIQNYKKPQNFIRYFIIFRCFMPVIYDTTLRKNMMALFALYKDILVFTFFYASVIIIFAIIAKIQVHKPKDKQNQYDEYKQNYYSLNRGLFLIYALSSFQGFPDNQLKAIKAQPTITIFFICFIFLNLFFFITIPTSLLFKQFKDVRSKIILVGEMKQQSSLILAFACLCQKDMQIKRNKFISFLLKCFKNKVGYIDEITQIYMEVDQNMNQKIQITQFMQICKIINSHRSLYPPIFNDWQPWVKFRRYINQKYGLKDFFFSPGYKIFGSIFILFAIINCLLNIFTSVRVFYIVDIIIAVVFLLQLILKLIAIGPQNYFKDPWNKLDFFIIIIIVGGQFAFIFEQNNNKHVSILLKVTRSYRIALLPQYLFDKRKFLNLSGFTVKISRMITQMLMTISIVIQFFPIYLIFFYIFGVLGLQIFGNLVPTKAPQESPYSTYNQFANFDSFIYTQFYMVQILIEGGWSMVCFDYSFRYSLPEGLTMLFFATTHFSIVLIVNSLIKGVTWQVYQKIQQQTNIQEDRQLKKLKKQKQIKEKKQMLQQVRTKINLNQSLNLQNLISRQIYQQKVDQQILSKMLQAALDEKNDYMTKKTEQNKRKNLIPALLKDLNLVIDQFQMPHYSNHVNNIGLADQILANRPPVLKKQQTFLSQGNQYIDNVDDQIQQLINKAIIDGKHPYTETMIYPKLLANFLQKKLKTVEEFNQQNVIDTGQISFRLKKQNKQHDTDTICSKFNVSSDKFSKNSQSMSFLTDSLKVMLEIKISQQQLKNRVILRLIETETVNKQEAKTLLEKKKAQKRIWMSPTWILRQTFLANTSQKMVNKFQIQYFSNVYGQGFKQINGNTIQPLLRLQSKLTYCLRNALRYKRMNQLSFFQILNQIQDVISSRLLRKGSLFKFIYQIDSLNQSWFSIQVLQNREIKVHFIKNGIWIWHRKMKQKQIYLAKDLFYCKDIQQQTRQQQISNSKQYQYQRYIKMLFQSFQTLGMCIPNQKNFFIGNPQKYQYGLYSFYNNTQQIQRTNQRRFSISKIMVIALTNQGKRIVNNNQQQLKYQLTDMKLKSDQFQFQQKNKQKFNISLTRKFSLQRFQKIQTMQQEQIQDQDGLPHAYIINLFQQIQDILQTDTDTGTGRSSNFIYHLQNLINRDVFTKSNRFSSNNFNFIQQRQSFSVNMNMVSPKSQRSGRSPRSPRKVVQLFPNVPMEDSQSLLSEDDHHSQL